MRYLLDTSVVIDYLHGNEAVVRDLRQREADGLAVSAVVVAELYEGVFRATDPRAAERVVSDFLQGVVVLPVDEAVARVFGERRAALRRHGASTGDLDLLIGATALSANLTLLTRDRDFERIEGLEVQFPAR